MCLKFQVFQPFFGQHTSGPALRYSDIIVFHVSMMCDSGIRASPGLNFFPAFGGGRDVEVCWLAGKP